MAHSGRDGDDIVQSGGHVTLAVQAQTPGRNGAILSQGQAVGSTSRYGNDTSQVRRHITLAIVPVHASDRSPGEDTAIPQQRQVMDITRGDLVNIRLRQDLRNIDLPKRVITPGRDAAVSFQDNAVEIAGGDLQDRRAIAWSVIGDLEVVLEIAKGQHVKWTLMHGGCAT